MAEGRVSVTWQYSSFHAVSPAHRMYGPEHRTDFSTSKGRARRYYMNDIHTLPANGSGTQEILQQDCPDGVMNVGE